MGSPTQASREGRLSISKPKLEALRPWWFGWKAVLTAIGNFIGPPLTGSLSRVRAHLQDGDANAALLLEVEPALVAAYSEDLDAVTLLTFPPGSVDTTGMKPGTKLIAINMYIQEKPEADLLAGPNADAPWTDFHPIIADFVSEDTTRITQLKGMIPPAHWQRCAELAKAYRRRLPGKARDGRPGYGGLRAVYEAPAS